MTFSSAALTVEAALEAASADDLATEALASTSASSAW